MKQIYILLLSVICCLQLNAQCPAGQTEITIEINIVAFDVEIGWELVDQTTGAIIACRPAGTYTIGTGTVVEGPFCVPNGNNLTFVGYDSFGDDWNGGFFNLTITEDGSVNGCAAQNGCVLIMNGGLNLDVEPDVMVTNSCETSNQEFMVSLPVFGCDSTPIMGCTNPDSPDFDMCATVDDGSCLCSVTQIDIADGAVFTVGDPVTSVTPNLTSNSQSLVVTAIQTVDGGFDNEHGLGLYQGAFDDGSVLGLPPAGSGLFGTDTEASIEASTPGANNINTVGNFGNPSAVGNSFSSVPLVDGAMYTLFIVDDFGDGWDGSNAELVDCEGNVILSDLAQFIDPIASDIQDELAWTTFTFNAPAVTIAWTGTGAVTTDPDGIANSGDETYTFDPSAVVGPVGAQKMVDLLMSVTSCGATCETEVSVTVDCSSCEARVPAIVPNGPTTIQN